MIELQIERRHMTVRVPDLVASAFGVTKSEARRKIAEGGVRVDGEKWPHLTGCVADFDGKVLQLGKRRFVRCTDR